MRGHDQIIAMRLSGIKPESVHIWCGTDALKGWKDWQESTGHAEVQIEDGEALSGLDLRFVVGLLVFVNGTNPFRVAAIHAGCLASGAARVLSAATEWPQGAHREARVMGRVLDSAAGAL